MVRLESSIVPVVRFARCETGASSGGRNPAEQHPLPIHPLGAPWPPRSIQGKMLIAISESRRPRRNSVRYPVNAGLGGGAVGGALPDLCRRCRLESVIGR